MFAVAVCERMSWDYYTYLEQPTWFVEGLARKWEIDRKEEEKAAKKTRRA